jgi:hypothetical protein
MFQRSKPIFQRSKPISALLLATALAAAPGCGKKDMVPEGEDLAGGGGDNPDLAGGGGPMPDLSMPAGAVDLTGVWAVRVVNAQDFESQLLGKDTVYVTTLLRADIKQSGKMTTGRNKACSVELTPFKGNQTIYPDAALAAIPEEMAVSMIGGDGGVGSTFTPQRRVQLVGWTAKANPETEELPKDAKDPRVVDADMDKKPGVTLKIDGLVKGEVYAVNRSIVEVNAKIEGRDRVAGLSRTVQAQVVLDAMPPLLKSEVKTTPNPDASKSTYTMVRLPAGSDTCDYIKKNKDALFK